MVDEDEALRIDGAARGAAVLDDAAALARRKRLGMSDRRIDEADRRHARSRCARRA